MINTKLLDDYKEETYINACRLFIEACILFANNRYSTSFVLATFSYEEVGKLCIIDRVCDAICLNPESADRIYEDFFSSSNINNHIIKHQQALFDASNILPDKENKRIWDYVSSGGLDQRRQSALYVDVVNFKIKSPKEINSDKAYELINMTYDAFNKIEDIGFNGYQCIPTEKSTWKFNKKMEEMNNYFLPIKR
jgi:AbiV family abortive infection protein